MVVNMAGCVKGGSRMVKEHKWFTDIDWEAVYNGQVLVGFLFSSFAAALLLGTFLSLRLPGCHPLKCPSVVECDKNTLQVSTPKRENAVVK